MKTFKYRARDRNGKLISAFIEARDEDEVLEKIKNLGYILIDLKQTKKPGFQLFIRRKVALSDINIFTIQLLTLTRAGVPLLSALLSIKEQIPGKVLKEIVENIIKEVEKGRFFSEALSKYENIFGKVYVNMIRSAEAGGTFEDILERLVFIGERDLDTRAKLRAATAYPVIVVSALLVAFFVLVLFVIPRFAKLFSQFNVPLPLPTHILIGTHSLLANYWLVFLMLSLVLFIGFVFSLRSYKGRVFWDNLKIKIPILGPLILKIILSRLSRLISILTHTGVPLLEVLKLAESGARNLVIEKAIERISKNVNEGRSMAEAMKATGIFPPLVVQMVSVGEETGKIDELLMHVSKYYDMEVERGIRNLSTYLEPILIFILACAVLFIALSVFLPMWNLIQLFKH